MDMQEIVNNESIRRFFQITDDNISGETMEILKLLEECNYKTGEDIVTYGGDAEDGLYIILNGVAEVLNKDNKLINILKTGSFIGELALISGKPRMATVRAKGELFAVRISRNMFYKIVNKNPKIYATFMEVIYSNMTQVITEQQRIKAELNVAKKIQESSLVKDFKSFDADVFATMEPAKEVGGDFYDVIKIDEAHIGILIADVSGKGISAALFMLMAKTIIKNLAKMKLSPSELLERANDTLCEGNEANMFITAFFGIIDVKTGEFIYANAGHNPPLILKDGKFEWLNVFPGFVLAGMENMRFKEQKMILNKDNILFLYTDGVTEAQNGDEELFSEDRLIDFANKKIINEKNVINVLKAVRCEIEDFVKDAEQSDDITMMAIKLK